MKLPPRSGAIAALVALAACTPPRETAAGDAGGAPSRTCARFGQTCEVAPGKLGTCVPRTGCAGDDCLICQSQH